MKLVLALQGTPRPGPAPHPGRTSRTTTPRRGTAGSKALHRGKFPFSYVECSAGRLARAFLGGNFEKLLSSLASKSRLSCSNSACGASNSVCSGANLGVVLHTFLVIR